jgi:hypothetical protein
MTEEDDAHRHKWNGDNFMMGFLIARAHVEPEAPLRATLIDARERARAHGYTVDMDL